MPTLINKVPKFVNDALSAVEQQGLEIIDGTMPSVICRKDGNLVAIVFQKSHKYKIKARDADTLRALETMGIECYCLDDNMKIQRLEFVEETEEHRALKELVTLKVRNARSLLGKFSYAWLNKYGVRMLSKKYYYKTMYELLDTYEAKDIEGAIKAYFETTNKMVISESHPIQLFLSSVDRYIAASKAKPEGRARTR